MREMNGKEVEMLKDLMRMKAMLMGEQLPEDEAFYKKYNIKYDPLLYPDDREFLRAGIKNIKKELHLRGFKEV